MSVPDVFKEHICARLTMTALEIFREFEKTLFGHQEEISRSKEESARIQRLLDAVTKPYIKLHQTGTTFILQYYKIHRPECLSCFK